MRPLPRLFASLCEDTDNFRPYRTGCPAPRSMASSAVASQRNFLDCVHAPDHGAALPRLQAARHGCHRKPIHGEASAPAEAVLGYVNDEQK